ncbi:MAG: tyrosine-type recombinase/integrase, partial [Microvirga sp.]
MAKPLTAIAIANLKPRPQRYEVSDPGCRGLRVAVFPSGSRSFLVRFRFRGLQRKLTLGPCLSERGVAEPASAPEIGTPQSLGSARSLCAEKLREAKSGRDPCAALQKARQKRLAAEGETLRAISEEYLRRQASGLRSFKQRRADLELLCESGLGRQPVAEITRGQFTRVLDHIADHNGPVRADRVLSAAKTLLGWYSSRSDYVPVLGRGGRRTRTAERARSRVLADDELRRVWLAAEGFGVFGALLKFLTLTAVRRSEASGMRFRELSDGDRTWTIPAARYKSGRDVVVPLGAAAQRIIAERPQLGADAYVFSSTDGALPLGSFSNRKERFDAACAVTDWRLHDLRRTSRTLLSRAGITADIAEMVLGHALSGVRGVYDRFAYLEEKRHAFDALARTIERIV